MELQKLTTISCCVCCGYIRINLVLPRPTPCRQPKAKTHPTRRSDFLGHLHPSRMLTRTICIKSTHSRCILNFLCRSWSHLWRCIALVLCALRAWSAPMIDDSFDFPQNLPLGGAICSFLPASRMCCRYTHIVYSTTMRIRFHHHNPCCL